MIVPAIARFRGERYTRRARLERGTWRRLRRPGVLTEEYPCQWNAWRRHQWTGKRRCTISSADVRRRLDRPRGFGVEALQGAFTLWNRQSEPEVALTAELLDIAVGTRESPVRGSGVFVGGHGNWDGAADRGTVRVSLLRTGEIHTDGAIPHDTPNVISGGLRDQRSRGRPGGQCGSHHHKRSERHGPLDNWAR